MFRPKKRYLTHNQIIDRLERKKRIAEMKYEERQLKAEIFKMYCPFSFKFRFNKFIVIFCIVAIIAYTIAAILLQKYTYMELSPTLTTCVFAFFGTELIGLVGIKICDTKFEKGESSKVSERVNDEGSDTVEWIDN